MKIPRLPMEIMDEIVLYTGDPHVANVLKDKISQYVLDRIEKNILIYGNVQGGKTAEIFNYINENSSCQKVLVIQNSLLVLKQYDQRLKTKNIDYQIFKIVEARDFPPLYEHIKNQISEHLNEAIRNG